METNNTPATVNPDELAAAQEEAKADKTNLYTHELERPIQYNGRTIEELSFDFDKVTGFDCLAIEKEVTALGTLVASPSFNGEYQIRFAAKACTEKDVGWDIFGLMKSRDFLRITSKVRNFMLRADL